MMASHVYAVAKNYKEAADIAKEAQLRAERRAGEFLIEEIPHQGGRPEKQSHHATVNNPVKLSDLGIQRDQSSRWQSIASISELKFEQHIDEKRRNGDELTQTGLLKLASKQQQVQVTIFSSEQEEYYTPPIYLNAAHEVMGKIDLDPASCEAAQRNVKAKSFLSIIDDGLAQEWHGTIWLNPPYGTTKGKSNQGTWAQKLIEEYEAGRVSEAILLVKAALGYNWFEDLWYNWPVCFARERLSFIKADGTDDGQSKQGTAFFYFGPNIDEFKIVFGRFGRVILPEDEEKWRNSVLISKVTEV